MLITIQIMLFLSTASAWADNPANEITAIELREMTVKSGAIEWVLLIQGAALALLVVLVLNVSIRKQILSGLGLSRPAEKSPDYPHD